MVTFTIIATRTDTKFTISKVRAMRRATTKRFGWRPPPLRNSQEEVMRVISARKSLCIVKPQRFDRLRTAAGLVFIAQRACPRARHCLIYAGGVAQHLENSDAEACPCNDWAIPYLASPLLNVNTIIRCHRQVSARVGNPILLLD